MDKEVPLFAVGTMTSKGLQSQIDSKGRSPPAVLSLSAETVAIIPGSDMHSQ